MHICFLACCGFCISTVCAVPRYVSLSLLVAGFFVQLSHLTIAPMHWLSFISYPRFAITGLSRLELHGVNYYPPSRSLLQTQVHASKRVTMHALLQLPA